VGKRPGAPSQASYQVIADGVSKAILNPDAKYTNPPKSVYEPKSTKKSRLDLSLERDAWVRGRTAPQGLGSSVGMGNPPGSGWILPRKILYIITKGGKRFESRNSFRSMLPFVD
jgi:hypothetical protein